jgi:hypothetical protein
MLTFKFLWFVGNSATNAYSSNFLGQNVGSNATAAITQISWCCYSATTANNSNFGNQAGYLATDASFKFHGLKAVIMQQVLIIQIGDNAGR